MNGVSGMGLSIRGRSVNGRIRESCGICGKLSLLYVREPDIQLRHFPVLHVMSNIARMCGFSSDSEYQEAITNGYLPTRG